jgi:hypothetical protein
MVAFLLLKHILQEKQAQKLSVEVFVDVATDVVLHGILPE